MLVLGCCLMNHERSTPYVLLLQVALSAGSAAAETKDPNIYHMDVFASLISNYIRLYWRSSMVWPWALWIHYC
jgi:hypothetical protein